MKAIRKHEWLTVTEVALILGRTPRIIRAAIVRGEIKSHRVTPRSMRRVDAAEVRRLLGTDRYSAARETGEQRLREILSDTQRAASIVDDAECMTTGEAAEVLRVAAKTVGMLIDAGKVIGWRVGASGNDRRTTPAAVVAYMEAIGMPQEWIDQFKHERGIS